MARPVFRTRSLLTVSILAWPTLSITGACSPAPTTAQEETQHPSFGDGSTTVVHDATTPRPPVDAAADSSHPRDGGDGALDGPRGDGATLDAVSDVTPLLDDAGAGSLCTSTLDCSSHVCARSADAAGPAPDGAASCSSRADGCTCQAATCTDGVKNGAETDVDCGGPTCGPCADAKTCTTGSGCVSGECGIGTKGGACTSTDAGPSVCTCQAPTCSDGIKNGAESDVDCGGSTACLTGETCGTACAPCPTSGKCAAGADCHSATCTSGVCACPAGMTLVQTSALGPYCIDSYEVTFSQYQAFTTAGVSITTQPPECSGNTSFIPAATSPATHPVTNVNWCDAFAYCSWSGKHLCGTIAQKATGVPAGAGITVNGHANEAGAVETNDPSIDEWYNACSAQGVYVYPYGSTFNPLVCNGSDSPAQTSSGPVEVPPGTLGNVVQTGSGACINDTRCGGNVGPTVASGETVSCYVNGADAGMTTEAGVPTAKCGQAFQESQCVEGASPNLFDMSGNVAEWENACNGSTTGTDLCTVRGGAYDTTPAATSLTCATSAAQPLLPRTMGYPDVGFRCCL